MVIINKSVKQLFNQLTTFICFHEDSWLYTALLHTTPQIRMFSRLARCASRAAVHALKGASRLSKPAKVPCFGYQTLTANPLPTVGGSTVVKHAQVLDHKRLLQVEWEDGSCSFYPFTWLRDNCQCPLCTLQSAQARSLLFTDLDVHTGMDQVQITDNNKVRFVYLSEKTIIHDVFK